MQNLVEIPTPLELVSLSVNDLSERKQQIMNQIYEYVRQGQSALELSNVYKLYQDEWLMRLQIGIYKHRHWDSS
jgi:hypothetical protein